MARNKAASFFWAFWSFIKHGDAPLVEHDRRQLICLRCDQLRPIKTGIFCKACGCPPTVISDLRTKWRMQDIKCPLDKW